jgi:hypothetical protein
MHLRSGLFPNEIDESDSQFKEHANGLGHLTEL